MTILDHWVPRHIVRLTPLMFAAACASSEPDASTPPRQDAGNDSAAGASGVAAGRGGESGAGRGSGGSAGGRSVSTGGAGSRAGRGGTSAGNAGSVAGRGGTSGRGGAGGTSGEPSASDLLSRVAMCNGTLAKDGFGLNGSGSIAIYQCSGALYWKADMDVDCDGIQTPPCDTDLTGQPQTSIVDAAPNGDVDPTRVPYFVIPLGMPETTWYKGYGVALGQVGAVIYKDQVKYGIFADEAGGAFIGEASYAMCQLFLGTPKSGKDPCDPNSGGIDEAEVTFITFTGTANQVKGTDIYDHETHTRIGSTAAKAWLTN